MKNVNVEIMGQNLIVASDDDDNWVRAVAETVDERIRHIRNHSRTVSSVNIAILAALNFADELQRLRREHQQLIEHIEALSQRLSATIDSHE